MRRGHGPILTVAFDVRGDEATPHHVALASLTSRFSPVDSGSTADVRVVAGASGAWPELAGAALEQGPKAIVVASRAGAGEADVARLIASATSAGAVVAVATAFAGTRTWRTAVGRLRTEATRAAIVDSVLVWSEEDEYSVAGALLDQLAVIAGIVPDISHLSVGSATPHGYVVAGMAGRVAVVLAGTRCQVDSPRLQVDVAGTGSRWRVYFDAAAPAIPAIIERYSADRIGIQPLGFESGYRAVWHDLYDRLVYGVGMPGYLSIDTRELALANRLISVVTSASSSDSASSTTPERSG